jgi:hypothetical protein
VNSHDPWRVMLSSPPGSPTVVPALFYGHPFYGDSTTGRTFVGALVPHSFMGPFYGKEAGMRRVGVEAPSNQRGKLTAAVAPVLAPATGGITARLELDDKQVLHGAICVDGKCYESSVDLAPAIAAILARFAQYHAQLHAAMPGGGVPTTVVVGAIDAAVGEAGDALIGALVGRHVDVACAGFLDDILNTVKGLPVVGDVLKTVGETVKGLKEPLKAAAPLVATALGGPAAGAAASQFTGSIIDSLAGGKDTPEKAAAEKQAKVDPNVATALSAAKEAVAHTVAIHHTSETAKNAAAGHPVAQRHVAQLVADAERGDPAARAAAPLVAHGFMTAAADRRQPVYQQAARRAIARELRRYRGPVAMLGFVREGRRERAIAFRTAAEANRWYASLSPAPGAYSYAALYDARDLSAPVAESFGGPTMVSGAWVDVVGAWPWYAITG